MLQVHLGQTVYRCSSKAVTTETPNAGATELQQMELKLSSTHLTIANSAFYMEFLLMITKYGFLLSGFTEFIKVKYM